ncbi:MAG: PAP2 family protein, partial [Burkholderiaceae bacterium]
MSATDHSGRSLAGGILLLVAALAMFGVVAKEVVTGGRLTLLDQQLGSWLHHHAVPGLTRVMLLFTQLDGLVGVAVAAALFAIFLVRRRDWFWLQA